LSSAWPLTVAWYGDRLSATWAPRSLDHHQQLLVQAGLTDRFWQLG
jgi:hypothetical protein